MQLKRAKSRNKRDWPRCLKHKTYRAMRKPTGTCETCWVVWFIEKHGLTLGYHADTDKRYKGIDWNTADSTLYLY